ncbi:MAG: hypothetical protein K2G89_09440 [Lachnospiraceae bacterium]|nr:hypothetical protein [Lachnospiraceae bacterium]
MKKIMLFVLIMSTMLFTAGCGRQVVNIPEDFGSGEENPDSSQTTDSASAQGGDLSVQLGVEEKWSEELALSGTVKSAKINAIVSVPDTNHMSVLTMEADSFTNEKKKNLMEALCDTGSVYIFNDETPPKWFVESEIDDVNKRITNMIRFKEEGSEEWDEEVFQALQKNLKELKETKTEERGVVSENYGEDLYYGICNGKYFRFSFPWEGRAWGRLEDSYSNMTVKEDIPDSAEISCIGQKLAASENLCSMSEEEAVRVARNFIEDSGYSGYGVYAINALNWTAFGKVSYGDSSSYVVDSNGEAQETWTDGYSILFTREVDGVLQEKSVFPLYGGYAEAAGDNKYGLEYITVFINDIGILDFQIVYPYTVKEVSASSTSLLSYEQAQGVFRDILQSDADSLSTYGETLNFNSLNLTYFRVADAESDTYALLPVWILANREEDVAGFGDVYYNCALMINAIDGSRINYMEELYVFE